MVSPVSKILQNGGDIVVALDGKLKQREIWATFLPRARDVRVEIMQILACVDSTHSCDSSVRLFPLVFIYHTLENNYLTGCKISTEMEFLNSIFVQGFWAYSSLLRLEFLSGFLPSFFLSFHNRLAFSCFADFLCVYF